MKKNICSIVLFLLAGISVLSAQNLIIPDSKEYQKLKVECKIPMIPMEKFAKYVPEKIFNTENFVPRAETGGGTNINCDCIQPLNGSFTLAMAPNDDGSTGIIPLPFNFCLYGTNQTNMYINNNGNISFGTSYGTFSANPFPDPTYVMVAPFWADVDTRGTGEVWYKVTSTYAIIRWHNVGFFNIESDTINDFQLIITDGSDPIISGGNNVAFCYGDMQWTTGAASNGINGFGGVPATVGINSGSGSLGFQFGRFDHPGTDYDGSNNTSDGVDWLDNKSLIFNACVNNVNSANFPPIADNINSICDTIELCVGDTFPFSIDFLSPEQGQLNIITIDTGGVSGFELISNTSGNTSSLAAIFYATEGNTGYSTVFLNVTDNGTPSQTTVFPVNIFVSQSITPDLLGDFLYCPPGSVTITLDSAFSYYDYEWSTGDVYPDSVLELTEGNYSITCFDAYGCNNTIDFLVTNAQPIISINPNGPTTFCNGNSVQLMATANAFLIYQWQLNGVDILNATSSNYTATQAGIYTVIVMDTIGCSSSADQTVTIQPSTINPSFTSSQQLYTAPPFAVQFTNTTPNLSNYNFLWYFGDGLSGNSNNMNFFHEYQYNGLYDVILYATDPVTGCTDSVVFNDYIYCTGGTDNPNGINDLGLIGFSIIPNPSSGSFTLNMESETPLGRTLIEIFNSIGQIVHSEIINNQSNILKKQINLDFAAGLYILRLTTNTNGYAEKLILK